MSRDTEIIAAIAQLPFWRGENQFTTVKPIALVLGDRLEPVREGDYPNRNLVWWMVRNISPQREISPGRLIIGNFEAASGFDPSAADKDKYQLVCDSVKLAGPRTLIEVIQGPEKLDPRQLVNRTALLKIDHPPSSMVLIQLGDFIYGPFRAEYQQSGNQFILSLIKPQTNAETLVFDAKNLRADRGFMSVPRVQISTDDRPVNSSQDLIYTNYQFLIWDRFESLQNKPVDHIQLFTDEEIVRQAAKIVLPRKRLKVFMDDWNDVRVAYLSPENPDQIPASEVFNALDARLSKAGEAVEELVQGLMKSGVLDARLDKAIEKNTESYLEANVLKLSANVEERIRELRHKEDELNQRTQRLENDLERRRRQEEAVLNEELSKRRLEFDSCISAERNVIEREKAEIATLRRVLEEGLIDASTRFRENRDDLVRDFLTLSPFFNQLGALGQPSNSSSDAAPSPKLTTYPSPPPFLEILGGQRGIDKEEEFVERFKNHVTNSGFRFRNLDLIAFHLSMKCGDLTILGGLSGTGKSSLPILYAQAMAGHHQRILTVDVNPSWLEPGDLLGRPNLLEGKFQPAPTGLFEHLIWAATEMEQVGKDSEVWIVCLDEMNLAQPEHYFSGFLQALPRSTGLRSVGAFAPSTVSAEDPWRRWSKVPLGSNLRFVGTVNYDETTRPLSQRLKDRANELRLEVVPLGSLQRPASTNCVPPPGPPVTVASLEAWTRETTLTGPAADIIDAMQQPLAVLGSPLTPRRYQAIARYVASSRGLCTAEEAFDMQLRQRVFSQLRGLFRPEARRALDDLRGILESHGSVYAGALQMIDRIQAESNQVISFDAFEGDL